MVGVPRSTGCQTCIQRRVKCDELRPECSQCQRYGVKCPGYTRSRKFQDEGPQLRRRFGPVKSDSHKGTQVKRLVFASESIDERVLPSLVSKSMTKQQPEVFRDFVLTAFPRWFGLNKYRVHVPWTKYVADVLGKNPAQDAAIYCVTCAFMGSSHYDSRLQKSSREMYSKALSLFGDSIKNGASLGSRESVSTSILLSLFEAYSRTDKDSWARHAGGAALMMSLRGANSHMSGFDRCLYLSFRSFLVAQAFVEGKTCIFDQPEWQSLIDKIRKEDMADPRADEPISVFIDISDRLFMEVVKLPGLISQTRSLSASPHASPLEKKLLAARVFNLSEAIRVLASDLRLAAAVGGYKSLLVDRTAFIGPIPSTFPQDFANSLLRGTENCFKILKLLHQHLTGHALTSAESPSAESIVSNSTSGSAEGSVEWSTASMPFHIISGLVTEENDDWYAAGAAGKLSAADQWLDRVASSMGMEAFQIVDEMFMHDLPDPRSSWQARLSIR